jgi:hypothetical protein
LHGPEGKALSALTNVRAEAILLPTRGPATEHVRRRPNVCERSIHPASVAVGAVVATALAARCAAPVDTPNRGQAVGASTLIAEARGPIVEVDGKRIQLRYRSAPTATIRGAAAADTSGTAC